MSVIREAFKNTLNAFANTKEKNEIKDMARTYSLNSDDFMEMFQEAKTSDPRSEIVYFTCLKLLSETIGKMPIKFYQSTKEGVVTPEETDISRLFTERPNPFMTPTIFWSAVEANRNHYGNGYVYIRRHLERKRYGGEIKTQDMWIMQSNCVQVMIDDAGIFAGKGKLWYVYTDPITGQQYVFKTEDVIHVKTSHTLNGITGEAIKDILKDTVRGNKESQDFMNKLYESGLTAKAVLEYTGDLNDKSREILRESFEQFGAGAKNVGRILPVPLGMKLTPLNIKLTDSQFFELKKYSALQIAAAFGVKPNQINDYEKSSYSNSEMQQIAFYVDTALFIIKQYEEEINNKALTDEDRKDGKYYKFNEKVLFRTDSKTQMDYFKEAIQSSVYKPNEVRRKLDMTDAEGGDRLYANGNIIPIEMAGVQYADKAEQPELGKE